MKCESLAEVLITLENVHERGVTFITGSHTEVFLSYRSLLEKARRLLSELQRRGLIPGDELVLQFSDNQKFLETFWACLLGGIIAVPLEPAANEEGRLKLQKVWQCLRRPYLVYAEDDHSMKSWLDLADGSMRERSFTLAGEEESGHSKKHTPAADDIAFIQFSSGSTGTPKGVVLTNKNLLTNIRAIHAGIGSPAQGDLFLSWMPLTHDMGLIGFHLTPLFAGWDHYIIPTRLFVRSPGLWLRKIHQHRITFTASPNFGYEFVLKHLATEHDDVDLSSVRVIVNGAEPISYELCRRFTSQMARYGLRENAIFPVYGLAEACLAVSFSDIRNVVTALYVDRTSLNPGQKVTIKDGHENNIAFVNVGKAVQHTSVRIMDHNNREMDAGYVGSVQICGDNVSSGYYNNPEETARVIQAGGWLDTGDLGFMTGGDLYITGRAKDLFFINGQNHYSHDVERIAGQVPGAEAGKIAVSGCYHETGDGESVVAFVVYREKDLSGFIVLAESCRKLIRQQAGLDIPVFVPISRMPKTTSGKIQRYRLREAYQNGEFKAVLGKIEKLRIPEDASAFVPPATAMEKILASAWQKAFGREVSVTGSFFDLGGNSLKAGQLVGQVFESTGIEIPVNTFYQYPTIREIAGQLDEQKSDPEAWPKVETVANSAYHPVASAQRRLFYHWQLNKTSLEYNVPVAVSIEGRVDTTVLQQCLREVTRQHESLRTTFEFREGEVLQRIHDAADVRLFTVHTDENSVTDRLTELVKPFDLGEAPLFRAFLLELNDSKHILFLDFHHIVADGISVAIILNEIFIRYHGGRSEPVPFHLKEYARWENLLKAQNRYERYREFWSRRLDGDIPVLQLNTDRPRPAVRRGTGSRISFSFPPALSQQLGAFSRSRNIGEALVLLAAYHVLLAKYTGQEEILTGLPVANRNHPAFSRIVGMLVNNVALKSTPEPDKAFRQYLDEIRDFYFAALDHHGYLFEDLVKDLNTGSKPGRNPLFDTMFIYQNMDLPDLSGGGLTAKRFFFDPGISKFDLSIEFFPDTAGLRYEMEFDTELFERETVMQIGTHFQRVIEAIIADPGIAIGDIKLLSESERLEILAHPGNVEKQYRPGTMVHEMFESRAREFPSRIAVVHGAQRVTFEELDHMANLLATTLRAKGIKKEERVCVVLENSPDLIAGLLGILKAGAAFVPVEFTQPTARKLYIYGDCEARFVLTSTSQVEADREFFAAIPAEDIILVDRHTVGSTPAENLHLTIAAHDLAYLIYTSGTTGEPKGVMIEHRNFANYVNWALEAYIQHAAFAVPLFTSVAFDLTITSVFVPLAAGNPVSIYNAASPEVALRQMFEDAATGLVKLTPSHLKLLRTIDLVPDPHRPNPVKLVVGGEALDTGLANAIDRKFAGKVEIFNEYGPTETTVGCTMHKFDKEKDIGDFVPVGKPVAHTRVYVLDHNRQPVPPGVSGEIYVAGAGVGRGYWKKDALTKDRFSENIFARGERLYRTGDIGRWDNNANLDFQGRRDEQVKIRGYRIELQEIKTLLCSHPAVVEALILAQKEAGNDNQYLMAYYVCKEEIDPQVLEAHLRRSLPAYMVPVRWASLRSLPLTKHGKPDIKALTRLESKPSSGYAAPVTPVQIVIRDVFENILGRTNIGIHDDFYALGGDSIKAVQISSALRHAGMELDPREILSLRSVAQISFAIKQGTTETIARRPLEGERKLSPIERWFFEQEFDDPSHYCQSVLLEFRQTPDKALLEKAMEQLIFHFDELRLNYDGDRRTAFYNPRHVTSHFSLSAADLSHLSSDRQVQALQEIGCRVKGNFNLKQDLLIRACLIRFTDTTQKLLIAAHHLIIDAVSWRILLADLVWLYNAQLKNEQVRWPSKTSSRVQWDQAVAENADKFLGEMDYWKTVTDHAFPVPLDFPYGECTEGEKSTLNGFIEKTSTAVILRNAQDYYKADAQVIIIVALCRCLQQWTSRSAFVIEMENHGRNLEGADVSRTTGWFTSLFPMHLSLNGDDVGAQILEIKEQVRNVPSSGIGYGVLKYLHRCDFSHQPKLIRLNYLGEFSKEINNALFRYETCNTGPDIAHTNHMTALIEINSMIVDGVLNFDIHYNTRVFLPETMRRFKDTMLNQLHMVAEHLRKEKNLYLSPSDFNGADLEASDLSTLFS